MFREFQVGNAASGFAYQHMGRHFLCSFPHDLTILKGRLKFTTAF